MIGLTTGLVMLFTTLTGVSGTINLPPVSSVEEGAQTLPKKEDKPNHPVTLEIYVRQTFEEAPILAEIARCESTFRHFTKDGSVLRGRANKDDIGLMQINEFFHGEAAKKLGINIYTIEGNIEYAKWLYEKQGSAPWVHSSFCWKKAEIAKK